MKRFENTYRFCDCDIDTFGSMYRKPKNWYGQCPKNYLLIVLNGEIVNLTLIIKKKYDQNSGIVYFIKDICEKMMYEYWYIKPKISK